MIEIKIIDAGHKQDIRLPNEPFPLFGRMIPSYDGKNWDYSVEKWAQTTEMRFPDEEYDYDAMVKHSVFLGAYDGGVCVGLAILQQAFFKYMYLCDLKVNAPYRRAGVGAALMAKAREVAAQAGYGGIYTIAQDNNLGACLFYLRSGFRIGGLDTEVYKGTKQEGKTDILFYWDF